MQYSRQTLRLIDNLLINYIKFDDLSDCYALSMASIAEFELQELSALLMQDDASLAIEATGPDNSHYESTMLPAMLKYFGNTADRDLELQFNTAWKEGITSYCYARIESLIDEAVHDYNASRGCKTVHYAPRRDNGQQSTNNIWSI